MRNLSIEEVNSARFAVEEELAGVEARRVALLNRQMTLSLLHQFQCKGVTRENSTWFIPGNTGAVSL